MVMRRRARVALGVAAVAGGVASLLAACFPDYAVGTGDGGSGGDGTTAADGSGGDSSAAGDSTAAGDGATGDGAKPVDGAPGADAPNDVAATADSGPGDSSIVVADSPYDRNPLANMVVVDGGTFYFQVNEQSTTVNAQATLAYTVAIDGTEVTVGAVRAVGRRPAPRCRADGASLDPGGPYQNVMKWEPSSWGSWSGTAVLSDTSYTGSGGVGCGTDSTLTVTWGGNGSDPIALRPLAAGARLLRVAGQAAAHRDRVAILRHRPRNAGAFPLGGHDARLRTRDLPGRRLGRLRLPVDGGLGVGRRIEERSRRPGR